MSELRKSLHVLVVFLVVPVCYLQGSGTSIPNSSAYGEILCTRPQPIIQLQFPYNINTDYVTTTLVNTGTVTQSSNMAVLQTGTNATGSATMQSRERLPYQPGQGGATIFTAVFTTGVASNTQIIGVGNTQDGFFFGYNGTAFGVLRRSNGSDTWVAQASWNADPFNGSGSSGVTLVPTNGNVYKIEYQWLGFGIIKFFIENPSTGLFVLVHSIAYANSTTTPSLRNPSLQLMAATTNSGNTTNITLSTSSMIGLIEGRTSTHYMSRFSATNNKTTPLNGVTVPPFNELMILTIQNKSTYQSVNNQVMIYPDELTIMNITADSNLVRVDLYLNPTIGGSPSFTDVSTNTSVSSFDIAGTTRTGGTLLATFYCCGNGTPVGRLITANLADMCITLVPGDRLAITATNTVPLASSTVYVGISWWERF